MPQDPVAASWPWPCWWAHRGAGLLAPENTLAAFRAGAALGWRAFECDVKLSADGQAFLLHDATLERCTNASGPAAAWRWAALARLDAGSWHSPAFAGEPLARLNEVADFVRAGGHALNVEIKPSPGVEAATGSTVASACAELWAGAAWPPLLSSFSLAALAAARQAAPALPRALLLQAWPGAGADGLRRAVEQAQALGCVALVLQHELISAETPAALRRAGLRLACYTVNEPARAAQLLRWGVDGLISDAVDRLGPGASRALPPAPG